MRPSLIWTPFLAEASERLFNIAGTVLMAVAGYLALPERMRSVNLYILPVGVAAAALAAMALALLGGDDEHAQNLDRGLTLLVMLLWPAMSWLRSRGRHLELVALAVLVAIATLLGPFPLPLQALAAGAVLFAVAAASPKTGTLTVAGLMAVLLVFAPLLPLALHPLAAKLLGSTDPITVSLDSWRLVVLNDPPASLPGTASKRPCAGASSGSCRRTRRRPCSSRSGTNSASSAPSPERWPSSAPRKTPAGIIRSSCPASSPPSRRPSPSPASASARPRSGGSQALPSPC